MKLKSKPHVSSTHIENSIYTNGGLLGKPVFIDISDEESVFLPPNYDQYYLYGGSNQRIYLPQGHCDGNRITVTNETGDLILPLEQLNLYSGESTMFHTFENKWYPLDFVCNKIVKPETLDNVDEVDEKLPEIPPPLFNMAFSMPDTIYKIQITKNLCIFKLVIHVVNNIPTINKITRYNDHNRLPITIKIINDKFLLSIGDLQKYIPLKSANYII